MSLSDLTFKLYTDATLLSPFSGSYSLTHKTDLSDNPQDFVLYFGSLGSNGLDTEDRILQASSSPGVAQISLTPTDTLDEWTVATAYSLGDCVEPTVGNGKRYQATVGGTSHATTEPTWPTSLGSTVVDNTVTWTCVGDSHLTTEIKLATTSGGLAGASAGAALNLGTVLTSGTGNVQEVHMRVTNAVTVASDNTGFPEIAIYINGVVERPA